MSHRRRTKEEARDKREANRRKLAAAQRKRVLLGVGAITVVFVLIAVLLSLPLGPGFPQGAPTVGQSAPNFTLVDINGATFTLSAQIGHPVLLDFMGSNCPSCVAEMPDLRSVFSTFSGRGLVMISIDIGGSLGTTDPNVARNFMTTNGGSWRIALDNSNIGLRYGVVSLPTVYIIDPAGNVAYRNSGTTSAATMSDVISRYV